MGESSGAAAVVTALQWAHIASGDLLCHIGTGLNSASNKRFWRALPHRTSVPLSQSVAGSKLKVQFADLTDCAGGGDPVRAAKAGGVDRLDTKGEKQYFSTRMEHFGV